MDLPDRKKFNRHEKKKAPKVYENRKTAMFIKGSQTNQQVSNILSDLYLLKKPDGVHLKKKNATRPFEETTTIEFLSLKNDASLFLFGSHSKKRPNNLVLGRLFDYHILDMIELGVENYKPSKDFPSVDKAAYGSKPSFLFIGEEWEQKEELKKLSNMLVDFYRGGILESINLTGLEHVIVCSSTADKVFFRVFRVYLKKSGMKQPRVELKEMGPSMDWTIRRHAFAPADLMKIANRMPKEVKPTKVKNVTTNIFDTKGRIHMPRQDLSEMATRKMKGLKRPREDDKKVVKAKKSKDSEE